ncbi:unnamed protein product, partial [Ixodes pacificus]
MPSVQRAAVIFNRGRLGNQRARGGESERAEPVAHESNTICAGTRLNDEAAVTGGYCQAAPKAMSEATKDGDAATAKAKGLSKFPGTPATDACSSCSKTLYPMERME